jgi:nitronate monooxygenase
MPFDLLARLRMRNPIVLAPMGGGPGTPLLAAAVANAGGLGSLAGAYLTPAQIAADVDQTRQLTSGPLCVNLFAGGYHRDVDRDPEPMLHILSGVHRELELPEPRLPEVPPDPFDAQLEVVLRAKPDAFSSPSSPLPLALEKR